MQSGPLQRELQLVRSKSELRLAQRLRTQQTRSIQIYQLARLQFLHANSLNSAVSDEEAGSKS